MIYSKNITKEYNGKVVLNDINFVIYPGDKIALIGENGIGKTTLLEIICEKIQPTFGFIERKKQLAKISYFPQEIAFTEVENKTILEFIISDITVSRYKIEEMLYVFSVSQNINTRMNEISGGEQTKIIFIRFLLGSHEMLLMDEPTNNIDIKTIILLEKWIKKSKKTFIIVSHDRKFLSATCTRILEIDRESRNIIDRRVNYTNYLKDRENEKKLQRFKYKEYINKKKALVKASEKIKNNSSDYRLRIKNKYSFSTKQEKQTKALRFAKALLKRSKMLKKIDKPIDFEPPVFTLHDDNANDTANKNLYSIFLRNLEIGYKNKILFKNLKLNIKYGERICLLGSNGSGKTTLLNTITKKKNIFKGDIFVGKKIKFFNVLQNEQKLNSSEPTINYFTNTYKIDEDESVKLLLEADLSKKDIEKNVNLLSPGQRMRLLFAGISTIESNTLILDEPTNHLDIETTEALEHMLSFFPGNIILVTHDRMFLGKIKNFTFYQIHNKKINPIKSFKEYILNASKESDKFVSRFINKIE